ncbi:cof family hydrolase [Parageobacillus genomosp. 1]|jgi:Cof subfamily protein (haloacid dehalogenase superfamily)|uniref:Cof family hydrolase n=1 Tax=Parageobacillus genomosp. 1 TaxID=1295642 RepID=A0ABC9VJF0_9BACL|nr:Cof-type HAD-IIB family hydrolase [Parageobacillus genomosp. 1]EZP78768.1 cof family hydrolase [Parageobacillus genomosp. 1]
MERYLIALDLDGTLLKDDKTISPFTKEMILRAKEEGHLVVIATGRPYRASKMYYEELGLTTPIVNFNGAFVHHPRDHSWGIRHFPLPLPTVKDIIEFSETYAIKNILAEVMDDVYFHEHDEVLLDIVRLGNPTIEIGDLRYALKDDPTSILIHTDKQHIEQIQTYLSDVHANVLHHRRWNEPWHIIEIVRSGVHKAFGLKQIADYFHIPKERVIAFGDEDNDLEMIEWAGHGIAMGNAIEPLKQIANDVTATNEEDGIGVYLKSMLKL